MDAVQAGGIDFQSFFASANLQIAPREAEYMAIIIYIVILLLYDLSSHGSISHFYVGLLHSPQLPTYAARKVYMDDSCKTFVLLFLW